MSLQGYFRKTAYIIFAGIICLTINVMPVVCDTLESCLRCDINRDGIVDVTDLNIVVKYFGQIISTTIDPNPDVNGDGLVNILDLVLVGKHFGEKYDTFRIFTENSLTGQGIPNAKVEVLNGNKIISSGYTDNNGYVTIQFDSAGPFTVTAKDEATEGIGEYFDVQAVIEKITPGKIFTFQMIPNLEIQNHCLKERYLSFLEMILRNTGNELDAVNKDTVIGTPDSLNHTWGEAIEIYIGKEPSGTGTDQHVRSVINELNTSYGRKLFVEVQQPTKNGWNFDYRKVDYRLDRDLTKEIEFDDNGNPVKCTFAIQGLYYYPNDLKTRLRTQIAAVLLLYSDYNRQLIETGDYDAQYFKQTAFSPDFVNILRTIGNNENGRDYIGYSFETNRTPVSRAGIDLEATVNTAITLDGRASFDPDKDSISYEWRQVFGTKTDTEYKTSNVVDLRNLNQAVASFTPQWPGRYVFDLVVTDDKGAANVDSVAVEAYWDKNPIQIRGVNAFAYWDPNIINTYTPKLVEEFATRDHVQWIEFAPYWWMENKHSNDVQPLGAWKPGEPGYTISDNDLTQLIEIFHSKGLKVFLRPTLEFYNWSEWRGGLEPTNWDEWFESYDKFITHYAEVAQKTGVEMFAVGTELKNAYPFTDKWTNIIARINDIYSGALTCCDSELAYGISNIQFWDKLDYIGLQFAFPITGKGPYWNTGYQALLDPPFPWFLQSLENSILTFVKPVQEKYKKPVIITEFECANIDGTNLFPGGYDFSGAVLDNREQAMYYEALLQKISDIDWIKGIFSFVWTLQLDYNFTIADWPYAHNPLHKPASDVIRIWFKIE